jgi:hypothetical protein
MSYAFLNDVYDINQNKEKETDYGLIVSNILDIEDNKPGLKNDLLYTKFTPIEDQSNELNYSNLEKMSSYIEDKYLTNSEKKKENFQNEMDECINFIKHLEKCKKCRQFLIKKFNLDKKPEDIKREQYLDIVIFTLSGIFVLFLFDMIFNFGKSLNKK